MQGRHKVSSYRWDVNGYRDAKRRRRELVRRRPPGRSSDPASHFPINRLPQDVLAEIFVHCLPELGPWPSNSVIKGEPSQRNAPLLLCSVCSSWRELAISVPRLWQRLSIDFDSGTSAKEATALVHRWIKRSGALPLILSLRFDVDPSNYPDGFQPAVEAMLGALVYYASRWESFHYHSMGYIPAGVFPEFGDMPLLRNFSLRGYLNENKLQISSWPRLTALCWSLPCTISSTPTPPWHQLTHLTLGHFITALETLIIIQSSPKLTELKIDYYDDDDGIEGRPPRGMTVVNNSLRRLDLSVTESCTLLLRRLTLPALTDLTLDFESCRPNVHKELLSFFTRSKCKLERLVLVDPEFDLLKCLEHDSCASITDLSIENTIDLPTVGDPILLALTDVSSLDDDTLLPNLAHLEFHLCLDGSPGVLGMMLLSRCLMWDKEDQLQSAMIVCPSLSRRDAVLMALAEAQGLEVTFDVGYF